jgi:hypothetical protein
MTDTTAIEAGILAGRSRVVPAPRPALEDHALPLVDPEEPLDGLEAYPLLRYALAGHSRQRPAAR